MTHHVSEGRLEACPLPILIARAHAAEITGMLWIDNDINEHWIYFEKGRPAGSSVSSSEVYLGIVARELGYVDDMIIQESLMEIARTGRLQGEVLVELGHIDAKQLKHILAVQLLRKVTKLFSIKSGTFRFEDGSKPETRMKPFGINPYQIIVNGMWFHSSPEELRVYLEYLEGKSCRLLSHVTSRVDMLGLNSDFKIDMSLLTDFREPAEFLKRARTGVKGGRFLLAFLLACGFLEIRSATENEEEKEAPENYQIASQMEERPVFHEVVQEVKMPDAMAEDFKEMIENKFEQVLRGDHLEALEIRVEATADQIRGAYITLAKVYNPVRVAELLDDRLLQKMGIVSARLGEAFFVMSHPERRAVYLENLKIIERSFTINPIAADIAGRQAEALRSKGNLDGAADTLEMACDLDPTNVKYAAQLAWIRFLLSGSTATQNLVRIRTKLIALLRGDPDDYSTNVYLTALFKLSGDKPNHDKHAAIARRVRSSGENPRAQVTRLVDEVERERSVSPKLGERSQSVSSAA